MKAMRSSTADLYELYARALGEGHVESLLVCMLSVTALLPKEWSKRYPHFKERAGKDAMLPFLQQI